MENDICNYVGKTWTNDSDKYKCMNDIHVPESDGTNLRKSGDHNRRFQVSWLRQFPGLCYSTSQDACFCKYCVFFPGSAVRGKLVSKGFTSWKDATVKFRAHFYGEQQDQTKRSKGYLVLKQCSNHKIDIMA